jgi:hypothetical protein
MLLWHLMARQSQGFQYQCPRKGMNKIKKPRGKQGSLSGRGSTGGSITNNPEVQELFSLWLNLTEADQIELLAIARKRVIEHSADKSPNLPQSN